MYTLQYYVNIFDHITNKLKDIVHITSQFAQFLTSNLNEYHWVSVTPSHSCRGVVFNWLPDNVKIGTWCCAKLGKSCASILAKSLKHVSAWNILKQCWIIFYPWTLQYDLKIISNHYAFITYITEIIQVFTHHEGCVAHLVGPYETPQNSTNSWSKFAKEFGSRLNWQTRRWPLATFSVTLYNYSM